MSAVLPVRNPAYSGPWAAFGVPPRSQGQYYGFLHTLQEKNLDLSIKIDMAMETAKHDLRLNGKAAPAGGLPGIRQGNVVCDQMKKPLGERGGGGKK